VLGSPATKYKVGDHIKRLMAICPAEDGEPAQGGPEAIDRGVIMERHVLGMDMAIGGTSLRPRRRGSIPAGAMDIVRKLDVMLGLRLRKEVGVNLVLHSQSNIGPSAPSPSVASRPLAPARCAR
jgi:hypothetical protein